ncbi:MAG: hypothetical protein ACRENN_03380 [Candidatus Eiseniibacteriota bacterium]
MRAPSFPRITQLAVLVFVGLFAGCGDDNPTGPGTGGGVQVFPTLNSPQNVLQALVTAYETRDSVEYRKLYDFDYRGVSQDLSDGTMVILFNADEVGHIQSLARATTVTNVSLSLGPSTSWTRLPSDDLAHPEWAVIQISGSQLRLEINDTAHGSLIVGNPANSYTFRFKPTPPDTVVTDTLWTIVQWNEVVPP